MAFLTLNGIAWPVAQDSAAPKIVEIGWSGRQIDGSYAATRRALKREWKLKTIPYSPTDALAFQYALLGIGHHWSFDSSTTFLYSDKGLLNSSGNGTYNVTGPTPKFGAGCIEVAAGASCTWTSLVGVDGNASSNVYSFVVWFWNGTNWDGYAGSKVLSPSSVVLYKNGVLQSPATPGFISASPSSATLSLVGRNFAGTNQISYFDDLVVFPFLARPADLQVWSNASSAFAALPQLAPGGDMIAGISPNAPSAVYGSVDTISELIVNTGDGNGLYDNAQQINFGLKES